MVAGTTGPLLHGFLVIDKPAGWTSHDVVARTRRLLGQRRIGHAGTLDPAATGVLPLAVGDATRVLEYTLSNSKTYLADVTFGVETDTFDADGTVLTKADASGLSEMAVMNGINAFQGVIEQSPPMYSAVKVGGRPLYEAARRGEVVDRAPRLVTVHRFDLIVWRPPVATVLVDCSKGTYVRSLAAELGRYLVVGAYLSNLVRIRSGPFTLCQAWTLGELEAMPVTDRWSEIALHPDTALGGSPALVLDEASQSAWRHGSPVMGARDSDAQIRVYAASGRWLGVATGDGEQGVWRPAKVVGAAG